MGWAILAGASFFICVASMLYGQIRLRERVDRMEKALKQKGVCEYLPSGPCSPPPPVGLASKPAPPPLRTLKEGRSPKRGEW